MDPQGDASDQRRLRELLDKQDITETLLRYCRGVDRVDAELIASAYHADAVDNHNGLVFTGADAGRTLIEKVGHRAVTRHCLTNVQIRLDGDVADCESYFTALNITTEGEAAIVATSHGRYVDRFERRDGQWKIACRVVLPEWKSIERQSVLDGILANAPVYRSRDDLSYQRLNQDLVDSRVR